MIPLCAPHLRLERYSAAVRSAIERVLRGTQFVLGREVETFERDFACYLGVPHCIGVNSGTDALTLGLRALGIGPGDEVITVSMTFAGTALAIINAGAEPRFIDVDPVTRCMDLDRLVPAITPRTAGIMPVHLHGYPIDMPRLMAIADRYQLAVIEDCAQAHGARIVGRPVGSWGQIGAFSFYPTKNLGCLGDGGAIVTQDPTLADRVRALRQYGWLSGSRISTGIGYNSRLDEIQAAVLNALLSYLDQGNRQRVAHAARYRDLLVDLDIGLPNNNEGAVYHQFAITVNNRAALRAYLRDHAGIETGMHYADPLHLHPAFSAFSSGPLPITEELAQRMVSLPIQPEVVDGRVHLIVEAIRRGIRVCAVS